MLVIPFPVCQYAANHCREGRGPENILNYKEGRGLKNKIKWNKIQAGAELCQAQAS